MAIYDPKSLKAEEFINDEEIRAIAKRNLDEIRTANKRDFRF